MISLKQLPLCNTCHIKNVSLRNNKTPGKYCSRECFRVALSERNKCNNHLLNAKKSKALAKFIETDPQLAEAVAAYKTSSKTIHELSKEYSVPHGRLRRKLIAEGHIEKGRGSRIRIEKLDEQFADKRALLSSDWIASKISEGYTGRMIAKELNCSPNYVCMTARNSGNPFPPHTYRSSYEIEICQILDELDVEYRFSDRSVLIGNRELDIYIPSANLAIEVNGDYWHSEIKTKHVDKSLECRELGIRLIHVWEHQFLKERNKVLSIIKTALGLAETRIYARECEIRNISSSELREFLKENHLQGAVNCSIRLGLFHKEELVSVMGFAKPRFGKLGDMELIRLCSKLNTTVVGAASKLWKKYRIENPVSLVVSYCDLSLFSGSVYESLGMQLHHISRPGYKWIRGNEIISRYKSQKHLLQCPNEMTEVEYMHSLKFRRLFDSGQLVFLSQ